MFLGHGSAAVVDDAAVDAALAAGLDEAIIDFRDMLNLPVEHLLVEIRHSVRIL